jgi:hypothetical protein
MGAAAVLGLAFAYLWPLAALRCVIYLLFHRGALDRLFMSGRSKREALLRERERRIAELERTHVRARRRRARRAPRDTARLRLARLEDGDHLAGGRPAHVPR